MNFKISPLVALLLLVLVFASSCGRTIYRSNYTQSKKHSHYKSRNNFWHKHHDRPRGRSGGNYW
ncbi:MAG: hypothetical protein V4649_15620 [Bacteroidota bacterium]